MQGKKMQTKVGIVSSIIREDDDIQEIEVAIDELVQKAINYKKLTGKLECGNKIIINTTAMTLKLGTGGYHYVIGNFDNPLNEPDWDGHIMKLRYTPFQIKCNVIEENEEYSDIFNTKTSIDNMIVCVATLHSMLTPIVCNIKNKRPEAKVTYIMTDGAALPIAFSRTVKMLKSKKLIDNTITIGHAFGGDYESINIYSALIAAKYILKSDIVVVAMGPGIVGTNSKFGFTGIEQGHIIDAVNNLKGNCITVPRVSFMDKRDRHHGISHHTITVLSNASVYPSTLVFSSNMDAAKTSFIKEQINDNSINLKHNIKYYDDFTEKSLQKYSMKVSTMGRSYLEDKEFFDCAGACGAYAADLLNNLLESFI